MWSGRMRVENRAVARIVGEPLGFVEIVFTPIPLPWLPPINRERDRFRGV